MSTRVLVGVLILIVCCVLAFLVPKFWSSNCEGGVCPPPTERRNTMLDWISGLDWYWVAAVLGVIVASLWFFFVK